MALEHLPEENIYLETKTKHVSIEMENLEWYSLLFLCCRRRGGNQDFLQKTFLTILHVWSIWSIPIPKKHRKVSHKMAFLLLLVHVQHYILTKWKEEVKWNFVQLWKKKAEIREEMRSTKGVSECFQLLKIFNIKQIPKTISPIIHTHSVWR